MLKFAMSSSDFAVTQLLKKLGFEQEYDKDKKPDFYVFTGGPDVSPNLYFEEAQPKTYVDLSRDYLDLCSLAAARLQRIPCVGICRGAQFLHVSLGGSLIQHIDNHAGAIHSLLNEDGGPIKYWEDLKVNSTHHQAIPLESCTDYDEVYLSPELTVEAFSDLDRLTLGVQYHPEYNNCPKEGVKFFKEMLENFLQGVA
jgi:putative glutamine amidotransferase